MEPSSTPLASHRGEQRLTAPPGSPVADLSRAPLPTADTLRKRQSIPLQLGRFVVFNARIMRMVLKGHSKH
ncbi:MAG: hypothetical protein WCA30_15635 [Dermatophilaceae bacterium]